MHRLERQAGILQELKTRGFIETKELVERYSVSLITIRRDLQNLQKQRLVNIEHGGVSLSNYLSEFVEPLYETKMYLNREKKEAIAQMAVTMLADNDVIFFDSGTTNYQLALQLLKSRLRNLTVFTPDIMIARTLCSSADIRVIVLGGVLRRSYYNAYGLATEAQAKELKANKLFLGVDGATRERGISNMTLEDIPVKRAMIEMSDQVFAMTDSTKFGVDAPYPVCGWEKITSILTDSKIQQNYTDFFTHRSLPVHCASL